MDCSLFGQSFTGCSTGRMSITDTSCCLRGFHRGMFWDPFCSWFTPMELQTPCATAKSPYTHMYADDIAMSKTISSPTDYSYLQEDIKSLCLWIMNNYLNFNFTKCCYMVFTRKCISVLPAKDLYIGNIQTLVKNHHYKYLRINLSSDLSWTCHVQLVSKKVKKLVGMLHQNFSTFAIARLSC